MKKLSSSNWTENEEKYFSRRDEYLGEVNLSEYVDHPFVFCNRQKIAAMLTRIDLYRKILNVQGSIVECGVHKGSSLMLYYHLSSIVEPYVWTRKVIGFDTFEGFRSISEKDPSSLSTEDFSDTSYEILDNMGKLSDLNRSVSHIAKLDVVKGDAVLTIPEYVENHPELIIALLYIDFDIYEPTKTAIEHLLPLVPKGGIVVFDELNAEKWAGETKAFKELLNLQQISLKRFSFDPMASYFQVE